MALEQRNKIVALQSDLTNSEEVQRDFVRLSQSLQQELERIRESGTLVIEEMLIIFKIIFINLLFRCDGNMKRILLIVVIVELYSPILKFKRYFILLFGKLFMYLKDITTLKTSLLGFKCVII